MSAQGTTLSRGTIHVPLWPLAGLVVVAIATVIGLNLIGVASREASVPAAGVFESTTQLREQGAIPAAGVFESTTQLREQGAIPAAGLFESTTQLREQGAISEAGLLPSQAVVGLENPGAYVSQAPTYATGLENPGAYPANAIDGKAEPHEPIVAAGEPCMQCR
jgi:hypothetical protein